MIPDAYCADRVRAVGGDPELIVRFAPAAQRATLLALAGLRAELEHLVEQQHDPAVASAKIAWWRTELAGFAAGEARHPATRALLAVELDRAALGGAMLAFSTALEIELAGRSALEPNDWRALLVARGRWVHALATAARASLDASALDALGMALAELELLATLGRRLATARPALDLGWGLPQGAFADRSDDALALVSTRAQVAGATLAVHRASATAIPPLGIACALGARRARRLAADPDLAWQREPRSSVGGVFTAWRAAL